MTKRAVSIADELAALADEEALIKKRGPQITRRRAVLWGQARRAGWSTAEIAAASRVEPVTVRQYERRHAEVEA